jgi:hypothetical protein
MSDTRAAITTTRRSTRFVAWTRAWRAGLVPYDDVADEIAAGEDHVVADVPGTWTDVSLRDTLPMFAKLLPDDLRVVLPAAGDPVGLPGPGQFTGAALLEGEGVIAGGYGLVPEVRDHTSGSGDVFSTVRWQFFELPADRAAPTGPSAAEAEADLNAALLSATSALTRLDIAQWRPELAGALAELRRQDFGTDLPAGYDQRARRLFARATIVDRVVALADQSAPGGSITSHEARARDDVLRPLAAACRHALAAACNAPLY